MTFEFTPTEDGFRIRDTIENTRAEMVVGRSVDPSETSTDQFRIPLDTAVVFETSELRFAEHAGTLAYTPAGELVDKGGFDDPLDLPPGTYEIEVWFPHFKLYLGVANAAVTGEISDDGTRFTFDGSTEVTLGVRSFHEQPAGTVTATQDPREIMRAISAFGSALKTLSPERSFPTLRGHPPELAIRGRTAIPDEFAPPDSGITVEIPPRYERVYTTAPLAYYFGATIEPGLTPRLVTDDSVYEFDETSFATDVNRVLRHCALLDCVVRTEGLYDIELYERHRLESRIDLDPSTLYGLPVDERTARYLDIPFDATADLLDWPYVADIDPTPLNAEALPYLAYRLAAIRSPGAGRREPSPCSESTSNRTVEDSVTRSILPSDQRDSTMRIIPEPFDAQQHLWIGDGIPISGVKPTLGSYLRSIDSTQKDAVIDQHVVCGDTRSDAIREYYRDAGTDWSTITIHDHPTTAELRDLLTADIDFLYFSGRVTNDGLECSDGTLDVRTLPRVGVSAFFLDAGCSYHQGLSLVHAGGIAGIVTISDDQPTPENGHVVGELLDAGFSLAAATQVLDRLRDTTEYLVVGDGDHQVCKSSGLPLIAEAIPDRSPDERAAFRATGFATPTHRVGTIHQLVGDHGDQSRLMGTHDLSYSKQSVDELAETADEPLIADGELYWLDDLTAEEVWELLR